MIACPIPVTTERRSWPEPTPECRICGVEVPSEDFGEYDELGTRCDGCLHDEVVQEKFRAAYEALRDLFSEEAVEEYLAGEVEDMATELAARFGWTVDTVGDLVETPNHSQPKGTE